MYKQVYFLLIFLFLSVAQAGPFNDMQQHEEAAEITGLKITLDKSLNGKIILQQCDDCKAIVLKITPDTKAFHKNHEVPLKKAKKQLGKSAVVFYEIKSKIVKRIVW
jgi:hypothetical protein